MYFLTEETLTRPETLKIHHGGKSAENPIDFICARSLKCVNTFENLNSTISKEMRYEFAKCSLFAFHVVLHYEIASIRVFFLFGTLGMEEKIWW